LAVVLAPKVMVIVVPVVSSPPFCGVVKIAP
jgi:hypothetical protein